MSKKQRRPVYVIQRKLDGVFDEDGNPAVIIIAIRQTSVGAELVKNGHEDAEVVKMFLVP